MIKKIGIWFLAKMFIDGVKQIEKQNITTSVLKICYKQKLVKENWQKFCEGVDRLLNDAQSELEQARKWV